ncbi:hypothetical protein EGT07_07245 [Herbaspirillum sp. HC18]|nr:hypothetical protein EGT07_07245 [Herbaspirillum sp. HC18]
MKNTASQLRIVVGINLACKEKPAGRGRKFRKRDGYDGCTFLSLISGRFIGGQPASRSSTIPCYPSHGRQALLVGSNFTGITLYCVELAQVAKVGCGTALCSLQQQKIAN